MYNYATTIPAKPGNSASNKINVSTQSKYGNSKVSLPQICSLINRYTELSINIYNGQLIYKMSLIIV